MEETSPPSFLASLFAKFQDVYISFLMQDCVGEAVCFTITVSIM